MKQKARPVRVIRPTSKKQTCVRWWVMSASNRMISGSERKAFFKTQLEAYQFLQREILSKKSRGDSEIRWTISFEEPTMTPEK
ncbi:hypothetical protein [Synechococcus sp. MIT S1220]|uniref:hypothetical protein n=1 Tax=Synechococcus sp. MIT S1220 TaxID=3082549 RepID=UPI0039B04098